MRAAPTVMLVESARGARAQTGAVAPGNETIVGGRAQSYRRHPRAYGLSVTPPCWNPKNHDLVNLDCHIAPGRVSFKHPLESCRSKCGRSPVRLERIVLAFNESERDRHDGMVRAA